MKTKILCTICLICVASLHIKGQEDMTHLIVNADLSQELSGWTCETHDLGTYATSWTPMATTQPCITEAYSGFDVHDMDMFRMYQKVALKAGMYRLRGYAFYRWGSGYASDINNADGIGPRSYAWLKAGNDSVKVMRLGDVSGAELRPTNYANVMIEAAAAFNAGLYMNTLVFTLDNDTTINLGYYGKADRKNCWFICGPMTLERISDEVLQRENDAEITEWKEKYAMLKAKYTNIAKQQTSTTTFDYAAADIALQKSETTEDIKNAIRMLSDALGAYMLASPEKFDITSLIDNPNFETGEMGAWSSLTYYDTGVRECSNDLYKMTGSNGNYLFNSFVTNETTANDHHLLQTLSFLPAGSYSMTAELATNQTTNLKLVAGNLSKSVYCTSSSSTTRGELNFKLSSNSDIRIGATNDKWFKADDFRLYFFNETYPLRKELTNAINNYEVIARQATNRSSYDQKVEEVKKSLLEIDSEEKANSLRDILHSAITELISTVPSINGIYDITTLIGNPSFDEGTRHWNTSTTTTIQGSIAEVFNITGSYYFKQNLSNMPAGTYTLTAKAFSRTTDFENALKTHINGSARVRGSLTLDTKKTTIKSIFDEFRFDTKSGSFDYKGMPNGASVPNTMENARTMFESGLYCNTLRYEKPTKGNLSLGINLSAAKANNWLAFDDFRLYYGKSKDISLDTLKTAEGIYANISSNRTLKAGTLEAVCLPYDADMTMFDEVYVLGSATAEKAELLPATEMKAGYPYFVIVAEDQVINATDVFLTSALPDSIPALWNGAFQKASYHAGTVRNAHILSSDGKRLEYVRQKNVPAGTPCFYLAKSQAAVGKNIPIEIKDDWMDMDFEATTVNFKVEEFLSNTKYTRSTPSVVNGYNIAPTWRRDQPRSVAIPIPPFEKAPIRNKVIYSQHADMTDSVSIIISPNAKYCYIYNLIPGTTYHYKVVADNKEVSKGKFTPQGHLRMLCFNSGSNMRDMGGWTTEDGKKVEYGKIYRGGELHAGFETNMSDADMQDFAKLGIAAEFDLRNNDQVENNTAPTTSALGSDVPYKYMNQYMFGDDALRQDTLIYRTAFNFFADNLNAGRPVYFHCIWGADRTGAMAMLLNGLLGVGLDQLYKDYELTSFSKAGLREKAGIDSKLDYLSTFAGNSLKEKIYRYLNEYVNVPAENLNDIIRHMLNDDTNAIHDVKPSVTKSANAPIYDLMGRKVVRPTKRGIYIQNGKKFIVR